MTDQNATGTGSEPGPDRGTGMYARALGGGTEPDPRFTLANERTFLAGIRTSLALLAAGIGLEAFAPAVFPRTLHLIVVDALVVVAAIVAVSAGLKWLRTERAMRHGRPLPLSGLVPLLSIGVAAAAVVAALVFVAGR